MRLETLFKEVSELNLSKQALEDYHTQLSALYGQMRLEMATLEKLEALYFLQQKDVAETTGVNWTDIYIKRQWNGQGEGQRLIELKNYTKGTEKILSSLKNRLYSQY